MLTNSRLNHDTIDAPRHSQPAALALLRVLMRQCRAKARVEPFEACALLHHSPDQGAQAYADALLRVLSTALPNGLRIHAVYAPERSFDENWLLALTEAVARDDASSATFLLRSRLPVHLRRNVGWLVSQLVTRINAV
ncbi:hypothetical protein [Roseicitreum antarcticum]|uniref:Uncharacterized protein n=1 Tax=Roseicitreum antarcticum TaxID=564137 RepID=A0A1H2SBJ5_9RHOB|nr:hypothetical protein [Roseicitreum antarcticum]SDW28960.1 hypothetical protein SAMN04488238_101559 [Roseicitreum antarcticum]